MQISLRNGGHAVSSPVMGNQPRQTLCKQCWCTHLTWPLAIFLGRTTWNYQHFKSKCEALFKEFYITSLTTTKKNKEQNKQTRKPYKHKTKNQLKFQFSAVKFQLSTVQTSLDYDDATNMKYDNQKLFRQNYRPKWSLNVCWREYEYMARKKSTLIRQEWNICSISIGLNHVELVITGLNDHWT